METHTFALIVLTILCLILAFGVWGPYFRNKNASRDLERLRVDDSANHPDEWAWPEREDRAA